MRIGTQRIRSSRSQLMLPLASKDIYILFRIDMSNPLCFHSENCQRILEHLKQKLDVPAFEWRRILKVRIYSKTRIFYPRSFSFRKISGSLILFQTEKDILQFYVIVLTCKYSNDSILQSLSAMEYLLKNGPPRIQQDLRNEMFKISGLQNFTYFEDGQDKGHSIRDKAILLQDLL